MYIIFFFQDKPKRKKAGSLCSKQTKLYMGSNNSVFLMTECFASGTVLRVQIYVKQTIKTIPHIVKSY